MRHFKRSFSRKGTREPLVWSRGTFSGAINAAGGTGVATVFAPTALVAGTIDTRLTLRRFKMHIMPVAVAARANNSSFLLLGLALSSIGAPAPSPAMLTTAGQQEDWLFLGVYDISAYFNATAVDNPGYDRVIHIDVKSMRKVDQDQVVSISWDIFNPTTGVRDTTATLALNGVSSSLFSRTRR